ncbi:MAG: MATE family efflux transporter [Firmicutes bacterium]|nr:MATE family efflux transporter [Bacillota bacterium]
MDVKEKADGLTNLFDHEKVNIKAIDKHIWALTLPSLIELMLATLFGMVDMVMVGNVSTASLAAVGISNQPMMLILSVFQALNVGTMALVARFTGTDDHRSSCLVLRQTLILAMLSGTVVSVLGFVFAQSVVTFMGAEPEVIPLATSYFAITASGAFFVAVTMGIGAALRGAGDTLTPMRYNLISNLFNVFGNYILIFGKLGFPALGVTGAALSTTISRGLAMIMALYAVHRPHSLFSLSTRQKTGIDIDLMKRILRIGLPSGLEQLALRTGQVEFARTVAGLGTTVFAAHQIALNVVSLSFAPSQAFGMAATTLVGQSLGAKRPDIAEKCGLETRRLGMIVAVSITTLFFFFGKQIAGIYTNDAEVALMTAGALKIVAIMQPLQSTQFILAGALRGAGDTRWPLFSTMIGIWGIRVVFAKLFISMGLGLIGAWLAQLLDQLFRSIFIYARYNSERWKTMEV